MRTFFLKLFNRLSWRGQLFTSIFSRRVLINFIFKNFLVALVIIIFIVLILYVLIIMIICKKVDDNDMFNMCFTETLSPLYVHGLFQNSTSQTLWRIGPIDNFGPDAKFFFARFNKSQIMRPVDIESFIEIAPPRIIVHTLYYPGHSVAFEYALNAINWMESHLIINKKQGAFINNRENFVYVDFVIDDIRICRTIYQYLRWIGDAGYITDKETLLLYEHHFKIILDLMLDGEAFAEDHELTFDEVKVSLNFVKNIIKMVKSEEEGLIRSLFEAMDAVRNKKRI